jgi:hypothetical protein
MAETLPNYEAAVTYLSTNKYPSNFSKDEKRNLRRTASKSYEVQAGNLFYTCILESLVLLGSENHTATKLNLEAQTLSN